MLKSETVKLINLISSQNKYKRLRDWVKFIEVEKIESNKCFISAADRESKQISPGEEYPEAQFLRNDEALSSLLLQAVMEVFGISSLVLDGKEFS